MITADDVRHVAGLARLDLDENDVSRLTSDLGAILGYIDRIADAEVRAQQVDIPVAPLRDDRAVPSDPGPLLQAAPALHDGEFSLPVVLP